MSIKILNVTFISLFFLVSCQGSQKTDLIFSDIASNENNGDTPEELILPIGDNSQEQKLELNLNLVDRIFLRNKFIDLFDLSQTEFPLVGNSAGYTHLTTNSLYDKIMPSIMWYGFFGSGCDLYESTNIWPYRSIYDPSAERYNWHESCHYYHRYSGASQPQTTVLASVSTSPRWAINSRICHLLTDSRGDRLLVRKMNFDLNDLPDLNSDNVKKIMEVFMPSYQASDNEIGALLQFSNLYPSPATNTQKLTIWKNVIEAVCQSPFWHAP
jgi:hypothetical protein